MVQNQRIMVQITKALVKWGQELRPQLQKGAATRCVMSGKGDGVLDMEWNCGETTSAGSMLGHTDCKVHPAPGERAGAAEWSESEEGRTTAASRWKNNATINASAFIGVAIAGSNEARRKRPKHALSYTPERVKRGNAGHLEEQEEVYSIIGKLLDSDPWEAEPEYKEQVAYVPKEWLSVPFVVWIPNINWIVFIVVILCQVGLTCLVFLFREEKDITCRGFCGSKIQLDQKAHTHTGVALFLLVAFRANSSYDRFWEVCLVFISNFACDHVNGVTRLYIKCNRLTCRCFYEYLRLTRGSLVLYRV